MEPAPTPVEPGWQDVPQTLYLSWSRIKQLSYCIQRDEDSARQALDDEWKSFYTQRAQGYRDDIKEMLS